MKNQDNHFAARLLGTLLGLCLFVLLLIPGAGVRAQPVSQGTADTCDAVQVIVMIDQSASMNRNDPNMLRYDGPMHLADILAKNFLLAYQRNQAESRIKPVRIEFAVVDFASKSKIQVDWTLLNPITNDAWAKQRAVIEPKLVLTGRERSNLQDEISNGTNFINAFDAVKNLLARKDPQENGCPRRLVVILTDGNPDQGGEPLMGEALKEHMEEVEGIVNNLFPEKGDEIYVTAFSTGDDYWRRSKGYWEKITRDSDNENPRHAEQANTFGELGFRLAAIVQKFLGEGVVEIRPGRMVVPPYVDRMTITFFKPERDNIIQIEDPVGILNESRTDVKVLVTGEEGAIQTIDILRPLPGVYQLTTTADKDEYIITEQLIFVTAHFAAASTPMQQFTTSTIEIEMVDSQGNPLPYYNDPKYALKVSASMTSADYEEIPISMTHLSTGILQGNFTPIQAGDHHLSLDAYALDDDNQKVYVIKAPNADFDLVVEPVTVEIGDPRNTVSGCAPAQYTAFEIPMSVINAKSKQPVQISVPVTWDTETSQDASITVSGPNASGIYTLRVIPNEPGELHFTIRASAPNPQNGQLHEFFKQDITVMVEDTDRFTFAITDVSTKADGYTLKFENFLSDFFGKNTADVILLGRKWFIFPQDVLVYAEMRDDEANARVRQDSLLPEISLIPLDEKSDAGPYQGQGWITKGEGRYVNTFSSLPLGRYAIQLDSQAISLPCGMELTVTPSSDEPLRLASDVWERVLSGIVAVIVLLLVYFTLAFVVCRKINNLDGYLCILNSDGKRLWYQSIADRSCWNFKLDPQRQCYLVNLKVRGWRGPKGEFWLTYKHINPKDSKKEKEKVRRSTNAWMDIPLPGGCRIKWVKTQAEVPPPV